ncbi:MAG TPA: rhomboid family intramembrane serine protease [Candidatus Kapabacteria bacterium]|nr:rhomboid family intramembrane serine protease [Candidatus Kapabacteria bacterium]
MEILHSPVALVIFISTIACSLYTLYANQSLYFNWVLNPYQVINNKKYYQLLTSGFLHADLMHLLFNMLTFYFFVFQLEAIVGSVVFTTIYFASLLIGNLYTVWKKQTDYNYSSVGASGAISGALFSFILFYPTAPLLIFPLPFPIPAWLFGILYLLWTYFASRRSFDMINHYAHLFGAIGGILVTVLLYPEIIMHFINQLF